LKKEEKELRKELEVITKHRDIPTRDAETREGSNAEDGMHTISLHRRVGRAARESEVDKEKKRMVVADDTGVWRTQRQQLPPLNRLIRRGVKVGALGEAMEKEKEEEEG